MNALHRQRRISARPPFLQLDPSQRLLLTALRHGSEKAAITPVVAEPLFHLFGIYYIEVALEAFETLIGVLADTRRQPPALQAANSLQVSRDERTLLTMIAAFQDNEPAVAGACANVLVSPENTRELLAAASVLAEALQARRVLLSLRDDRPLALMAVVGRG